MLAAFASTPASAEAAGSMPGVATRRASTSAEYLQEHGVQVQDFPKPAGTSEALLGGQTPLG